MKNLVQIILAVLIFAGLILFSTIYASAASPALAGSPAELLSSELPPDLFDEDCDGGPSCPGRIFVDMPAAGHWSHIPIDWALAHHITSGTSENTFSPGDSCTRAQAVMFLWKANGSPAPESAECAFEDVSSSAYYFKAVLWAVENHITSGTSETTFSPNQICTRAQIVTFLWRSKGSPVVSEGPEFPFLDVAQDAYYRSAVAWATDAHVTSGTSPTTFGPQNICTRAQIVTFLYRAIHG